jgi:UDP-N-acetylglucosamine 2-epimerase (non-hydrolysing)
MADKKIKILSVVGARPNFIKMAPLAEAFRQDKIFRHVVLHTGQHYDYNLSKIFFKDLELPEPSIYLGSGSASHSEQTAKVMHGFEKALKDIKPDLVIVYGDVNSTLACSLVCSKYYDKHGNPMPVVHIEAGLRSFDKTMPEEVNRIVTDHLSDYLFVTEEAGVKNLLKEGISKDRIFLTGDVMTDALIKYNEKFDKPHLLKRHELYERQYGIITIHRPVNTDNKNNLLKIIKIFEEVYENYRNTLKLVFPVHPRTLKMLASFGYSNRLKKLPNLKLTEPYSYTDFIALLSLSAFVLTDSGGIQSEATFLKIPCLTLRDSFEKPFTIKYGPVTLCGLDRELILGKIDEIMTGKYKKFRIHPLMDGNSTGRIVKIIKEKFSE